MHARIDSNLQVAEYPISDLRARLPDVSLPVDLTNNSSLPSEFVYVNPVSLPAYDHTTHRIQEDTPQLDGDTWVAVWNIIPLTADEATAAAKSLQDVVISQVQQRLDDFARTRFYDNMLSACTYATSSVPRLKTEGQYCVDARDATWELLFGILNDVVAGTREMPRSFADIENELPALAWPV